MDEQASAFQDVAELVPLRAAHQEAQDTRTHVEELERELAARLDELEALNKELVYFEQALSGREAYLTELRRTTDELEESLRQTEERCRALEVHLASAERARDDAEALVERITGWPAFRATVRYDQFRQAHPMVVAPMRWVARRFGR